MDTNSPSSNQVPTQDSVTEPKQTSIGDPTCVVLDSKVSNHPFLKFTADELYSPSLTAPNSQDQQTTETTAVKLDLGPFHVLEKLKTIIFQNKDDDTLRAEIAKLSLPQQSICAKPLLRGDTFIRCIDCDNFPDTSANIVQCTECFSKADHTGHRVLLYTKNDDSLGDCDCGRADIFGVDGKGHCPAHKPKDLNLNDLVKKLPQDLLSNLKIMLKKILYVTTSYYELVQKTKGEDVSKKIFAAAESLLEGLLDFCDYCYSSINPTFSTILGITLQETPQAPYNSVWHICEDLKGETDMTSINADVHNECKCSLIGNLLRLGNIIGPELQDKLSRVIAECMKEITFKQYFAVELTRYAHFLYGSDYLSQSEDEYTVN